MAQEYLPAPSNIRLADLMKEHNISQPELAKEIGCSKSTISRFISGAKGTLTHEQVLKIARLFRHRSTECHAHDIEHPAAHKGQDPGSSQSRKGHQPSEKAGVSR
mgnify:CR=1 FL=1